MKRSMKLVLGLLAFMSVPVWAADSEAVLADVDISPYEVSFLTMNPNAQHVLRVSCDSGEYFTELSAGGEQPLFVPVDAEGFALLDGSCNYELRSVSEKEGMEGFDQQAHVQFGTFEIQNGQVEEKPIMPLELNQ